MGKFNLLCKQIVESVNAPLPNTKRVVWQGQCSNGCNGVWKKVDTVSLDYIKDVYYKKGAEPFIIDDNGNPVNKIDTSDWDGPPWPLPLYFPKSLKEFKHMLDARKLIRFTHPEDMVMRLFSYDKKLIEAETEKTLDYLCDNYGVGF